MAPTNIWCYYHFKHYQRVTQVLINICWAENQWEYKVTHYYFTILGIKLFL